MSRRKRNPKDDTRISGRRKMRVKIPGPPGFDKFFSGSFQRRLEKTEIPELEGASWDRKAAYLLWVAEGYARDD